MTLCGLVKKATVGFTLRRLDITGFGSHRRRRVLRLIRPVAEVKFSGSWVTQAGNQNRRPLGPRACFSQERRQARSDVQQVRNEM